jgi:hypothetical protein
VMSKFNEALSTNQNVNVSLCGAIIRKKTQNNLSFL